LAVLRIAAAGPARQNVWVATHQHEERSGENITTALYVVATPLGNLGDITLRALAVLRSAPWIAAEDTRHSQKLLRHYGIGGRLLSLHEHNEAARVERILRCLRAGESVALVSDAGTPCISDPGARLVAAVREAGMPVIPIPGANAAIAALSVSGLDEPRFLFYGFLPAKRGARRAALDSVKALDCALVFYEAPHRVVETIEDLAHCFERDRKLVIARELSKLFETIVCLPLPEAGDWLRADPDRTRGEFVLVVSSPPPVQGLPPDAQRTLRLLLEVLPLKQAVGLAAEIASAPRNLLYARALEMRSGSA
jgi:16S rRNA (cytidine1402-2'-O)-methyltransferase